MEKKLSNLNAVFAARWLFGSALAPLISASLATKLQEARKLSHARALGNVRLELTIQLMETNMLSAVAFAGTVLLSQLSQTLILNHILLDQ